MHRPMTHKNNNYNCRVIIYNGKILMIRPKMWMANDGNYVRLFAYINMSRHPKTYLSIAS